ncbi:MAG: hypothetical protein M3077_08090 [Candidatus Dormibacteraeota bacterium]|nr:hypothetical protein [Candidatus Dormibacteraeota bacterium]MDQ6884178.1 hypothetical protein [Candidatus Dormibacteraeota bacterium]
MLRLRKHLQGLPPGVPQIYGAIIALAMVLLLAALNVHVGAFRFGVNWTSPLVFLGLNAVIAILWRLTNR